jgi:type VI secretion system protein ImpH
MAAQSRPADLDVAEPVLHEPLAEHPGSFDFFQAVRLLELTAPNGSSIRFHANPFLDFPPSQLESLNVDRSGAVDVTVNFLGLVGPQGALPYFYSELVQDRLRAKDKTLAAFLDIFHHGLISLFYQAWQKHRFPVPWERGEADEVSSALLALLGIRSRGLRNRQNVPDRTLMYYTGLLAIGSRPASALQQLLSDHFDVPVAIEEFAGAWYVLPQLHQCRLGSESCSEQLGMGAIAGDAIWDRQSRVRLRLGPMPLARYRQFLPDGAACREVEAITEFFSNRQFEFELELVLERDEVPLYELGSNLPLGWCGWLKTEEFEHDPDDASFLIGQQPCMQI